MKERLLHLVNSLTAKYVALFTLLAAVPAIAVAAYTLSSSYDREKQALIRLQQQKAQSLAATVGRTLDNLIDQFVSIQGAGLTRPELELVLGPLRRADPNVLDGPFYVGPHDRYEGKLLSKEPFFPAARKNGSYFSPLRIDGARFVMTVAASENYGNGVIREDLSVTGKFADLISGTRLGHEGYAYAVDQAGRPIVVPNRDLEILRRATTGELETLRYLPQVDEALRSKTGSTTGSSFRHQDVLTVWATVEPVGWKVFVEQPESVAFAAIRGTLWRTILIVIAFVAAAIALSILLARRLVRPIRRMRLAAARIGAGAYDERIELEPRRSRTLRRPLAPSETLAGTDPVLDSRLEATASLIATETLPERRREDDLGALADDLNRMAAGLQKSTAQLERTVEERTRELQVALERLAQKTRELEAASKHKSDFLANMSHELRTPLNAIIGFTQVLQQKLFGEVNDKQEEYLVDIQSSADHLLALINDILDLAKVEAGQIELQKSPFSLREALERGVAMVRERAVRNGVQLTFEPDTQVEMVEGDERRIRQVLFNLLSNAVKFTPERGRVDVRSSRRNGEVVVSVADTGPGIAPEDQERIFQEFQQTEFGAEQREGTGLGLALSKNLVELHGGRIWVESEPGQGSTFTFTIPVGSAS